MTGDGPMDISVIIVNWNTRDLLRKCLESVDQTLQDLAHEVIVVDNASADGSVSMVRERFPRVRVIANDENRGFGAANNQGLRLMEGRYALLLNSDTVLMEGAARELYAFLETHPQAAMACGQLLNADGTRQNSIGTFPTLLTLMMNAPLLETLFPRRFPSKRRVHLGPIEIDSGIGACIMVRKSAIDAVGMFDERYFFFFEETDWARQMRAAGWAVFHVPAARIVHLQGQSIGGTIRSRIEFYRSRYQYFQKWESPPLFLLIRIIIFFRLAANWCLTTFGNLLTLGMARGMRHRWVIYTKLLRWHLRGCP
ncbi:MAG: glycosyltransferase family 2 protein [Deltaproteobacteria bacterium]|nr:glycosyltransferase family 2 protein [Deltaproteobacteria bacterium]